jgi:hypothetical protein
MPPEPPAITLQGLVITVILFDSPPFAHFTFGHVSVHRDSASWIGRKLPSIRPGATSVVVN